MTSFPGVRLRPFKLNDFWASVTVILTGTVVAQVIGVVTLPLISRLYSPTAFGQYALALSVSTLVTTIVTLGLSSAVMAATDDATAQKVVVVAFATATVLATALLGVALTLVPLLPWVPAGVGGWRAGLVVYLMTIVNSLNGLLRVYTNRRGLNRVLASNAILGAVCTLVVALPLGFVQPGPLGLILAGLLAAAVCNAQMLYHANPLRHRPSSRVIATVLRDFRRFVLLQYPANLTETAGTQLPTQALASFYGGAQLGAYSMNERLFGVPLRLVGAPISTVYFRSSSALVREGESAAALTFSIVSKVMAAAIGPMIALIVWGPELFDLVLGDDWRSAGALCGYMAPLYVLTLCRASISYCRVVLGYQGVNAGIGLARLAFALGTLLLGRALLDTISGTILVFSAGMSIFMMLDMAVNFVLLRSHLKRYVVLTASFSVSVVLLWHMSGLVAVVFSR